MCCYVFVLHLPVFLIILQRLLAFLPREIFHCGSHSGVQRKFHSAAALLLVQSFYCHGFLGKGFMGFSVLNPRLYRCEASCGLQQDGKRLLPTVQRRGKGDKTWHSSHFLLL